MPNFLKISVTLASIRKKIYIYNILYIYVHIEGKFSKLAFEIAIIEKKMISISNNIFSNIIS